MAAHDNLMLKEIEKEHEKILSKGKGDRLVIQCCSNLDFTDKSLISLHFGSLPTQQQSVLTTKACFALGHLGRAERPKRQRTQIVSLCLFILFTRPYLKFAKMYITAADDEVKRIYLKKLAKARIFPQIFYHYCQVYRSILKSC